MTEADYARALEDWSAGQERSLRGERSWLSLVGLAWIRPRENCLGSDANCDVVLPVGAGPERVGILRLENEQVTLQVEPGVEVLLGGTPVMEHAVRADHMPEADVIELGRLSLMVITRAGRWGVRVWDRQSPRRQSSPGRT